MEITKGKRIRVNVATSVKGVKTWDATVEISGEEVTIGEVLAESNNLVAGLNKLYPIEIKEER